MSRILVLGGSYLQSKLISTGVALGHEVAFVDRDPFCYARHVEGARFLNVDLVDEKAILAVAAKNNFDAVISPANELGNQIAARICKKLGLLYNPPEVIQRTTDKHASRSTLRGSGIYSPKSFSYEGDMEYFARELDFPLIVKPSNSSASRGVSFVNNEEELRIAIKYAENYVGEGGVILVEEYIVGNQFSIETISSFGKHFIVGITKEEMSDPPVFIERSDFMGPEIHNEYLELFAPFVAELLSLMGVRVGPCHIEVIVKDNQVYLVEVASRSGGWRDYLLQYAKSSDYSKLIIDSYLGRPVNEDEMLAPKRNAMAGVLMYPEDMNQYLKAKGDDLLVGEYFNAKGPALKPRSLIDAYGYFYVAAPSGLQSVNQYSLH